MISSWGIHNAAIGKAMATDSGLSATTANSGTKRAGVCQPTGRRAMLPTGRRMVANRWSAANRHAGACAG